jgi:ribosomal protein S18 acetylase RimI-like enzyme
MEVSLWKLAFLLLFAAGKICAFSFSPTGNAIQVHQVKTFADWYALADVRYNEWMRDRGITRNSFRRATIEIYQEERPDAILFLAKKNEKVVGAAELSPIELQNALSDNVQVLYVTDVVTDRNHRRQGIAATLMTVLESHAIRQGAKYLVLNVAPENAAALSFYRKLRYEQPQPELSEILNVEKVLENAGTQGQLLLSKTISKQRLSFYAAR